MAQRVITTLLDDTDPSGATEADETLTFGLDGDNYEIDLATNNAAALRNALARYVEVARRATNQPARSRGRAVRSGSASTRPASSTAATPGNVDIRAWARANGIEVNERGRVPMSVIAKHAEAMRAVRAPAPGVPFIAPAAEAQGEALSDAERVELAAHTDELAQNGSSPEAGSAPKRPSQARRTSRASSTAATTTGKAAAGKAAATKPAASRRRPAAK